MPHAKLALVESDTKNTRFTTAKDQSS